MKNAVLFLVLVCAIVFAQGAPKIAVYATGGKNPSDNKTLTMRTLAAFTASGRYKAAKTPDAFAAEIDKEQKKHSNAVEFKQIGKIAKKYDAQFICVINIMPAFGITQISARILSVENEDIASTESSSPLEKNEDFTEVANEMVNYMLSTFTSTEIVISEFKDRRDGKVYKTINTGTDTWFLQDLTYGKNVKNYNWEDAAKVCPPGWHLPTNEDWVDLQNKMGDEKKVKEEFAKIPPSAPAIVKKGDEIKEETQKKAPSLWWSASELNDEKAYYWSINSYGNLDKLFNKKEFMFSVRCVKDLN